MKKSSVLIRRAALFTATVMAVTVAVSLCAGILGTWIQLSQIARTEARPHAQYLAALADRNYGMIDSEAEILASGGECVWLVRYGQGVETVAGGTAFPWESPAAIRNKNTNRGIFARINGKLCVYCEAPLNRCLTMPASVWPCRCAGCRWA